MEQRDCKQYWSWRLPLKHRPRSRAEELRIVDAPRSVPGVVLRLVPCRRPMRDQQVAVSGSTPPWEPESRPQLESAEIRRNAALVSKNLWCYLATDWVEVRSGCWN